MRRIPASELRTGDCIFVFYDNSIRRETDRQGIYKPYDRVITILPYPAHAPYAHMMIGTVEFASGVRMSLEKNAMFDLLAQPSDYKTKY